MRKLIYFASAVLVLCVVGCSKSDDAGTDTASTEAATSGTAGGQGAASSAARSAAAKTNKPGTPGAEAGTMSLGPGAANADSRIGQKSGG